MSQKTLNLCLERYNFVKFGETTKSSHTVLCTNNAYSVNSDKYRLTPTAVASKHGEGYVFTLNYDFDRPLFTIVQKSYTLDGTSGNIVFEGIDPISKGGSKYLRKVTVSPVKLSDGSYLLEVTNDEYLRIGTTGAALGDEELESLNEKIVTMGGIEKSVETVGGKQVLKLDGSGPSGKEIVYFDIDPSDPPSGIYEDIGTALSSNKLPAIRSDGKLYIYTSTDTDRHDFVGVFGHDDVGYEVLTVRTGDTVNVDKLNTSLGYVTLPVSGSQEQPAWAKVCELDLSELMGNGYSSYGLALLFTSDHINQEDEASESGIFAFDLGTNQHSNSNSRNASWTAYTAGAPYQKILGAKVIVKCGIPSNPAYAPYPIYKAEVWVKYYGSSNIIVNALQNACYNYNHEMYQGLYKFPDNHVATPQSTEPSYSDTEEYTYRYHFYPAESPIVTTPKSFMITPMSDWLTFDGSNDLVFGSVFSGASSEFIGDKIRMVIRDDETKYCIEAAKLGVYSFIGTINVKWDGTPVNRIGSIYGYEIDFSKNFTTKRIGTIPALVKVTSSEKDFYRLLIPIPADVIDAPIGVKISLCCQIQYLGNVEV